MRKLRQCKTGAAHMSTGISKCPVDWDKVKGAIVCVRGHKLPKAITRESLEQACHADGDDRIFPIMPFVEYAKAGGDPQTSANGYGPSSITGVDARIDTFTLDRFYEVLNASLSRNMNQKFDVYFWDDKNILHGYNDSTDDLAGFHMASIYPTSTPYGSSSAKGSMAVNFAYDDTRDAQENFDYMQLDFNPRDCLTGLTEVVLTEVEPESHKYKVVEKIGGYDMTKLVGAKLAEQASTCIEGATSASYDDVKGEITVVPSSGAIKLAKPSVLYTNGIKGIEQY